VNTSSSSSSSSGGGGSVAVVAAAAVVVVVVVVVVVFAAESLLVSRLGVHVAEAQRQFRNSEEGEHLPFAAISRRLVKTMTEDTCVIVRERERERV
jgi:predicted metalloprotease